MHLSLSEFTIQADPRQGLEWSDNEFRGLRHVIWTRATFLSTPQRGPGWMIITFNVKAMKLGPLGSTAYWRSQGLEGLPAVMPLRDRTWVYTEAY